MGTLRLTLALIVAIGHLRLGGQLYGIGHIIAVKAFFVISGFYMALVLNGKYRERAASLFYRNRILRLFPAYYAVLIITLVTAIYFSPRPLRLSNYVDLPLWTRLAASGHGWPVIAWMTFSNLSLFGLHWGQSVCVHLTSGALALTGPDVSCPPGYFSLISYSPIQPAWTLSVELLFYAVAPFLAVRRFKTIVLLVLIGAALRIGMGAVGLDSNPWNRTWFVFEFVYFALGILSFHLYRFIDSRSDFPVKLAGISAFAGMMILSCFWKDLLPPSFSLQQPGPWGNIFYFLLALAIPVIFLWSKDLRADNWLGELAYPAYICHILVLSMIDEFGGEKFHAAVGSHFGWILLHLLAIGLMSWLLVRLIIKPVESIRLRLMENAR